MPPVHSQKSERSEHSQTIGEFHFISSIASQVVARLLFARIDVLSSVKRAVVIGSIVEPTVSVLGFGLKAVCVCIADTSIVAISIYSHIYSVFNFIF